MRRTSTADDGFTMIEVMVAIAVISAVMLSLSSFFVITSRIDAEQGDRQSGIQAADDAMERARSMQASAILTGRDVTSSTTQWTNPIPAVAGMLGPTSLTMAADTGAASGAGASAVLPTTYRTVTLNGVTFKQYWYIGTCRREVKPAADCSAIALAAGVKFTAFYRVIVAVTWPGRSCASGTCSYVTSSLIGADSTEPVFNTNLDATPLSLTTKPGTQTGEVSLAVSLPFNATGGQAPLVWTATGLPAGLSIAPASGSVTGTPTTAATYTTKVTVKDAYSQQSFVSFTWTIKAKTAVTAPGNLSTPGGVAYSKTFAASGGVSPYTWSATGLPPGISIDASSGTASGTPTAVGTYSTTVNATDTLGVVGSQTFTWTVPALSVSTSSLPNATRGTAIAPVTLVAAGGIQPYASWSATSLPTGLTLDAASGVISGTPSTLSVAKTYSVVLTVTDASGATATRTLSWKVS